VLPAQLQFILEHPDPFLQVLCGPRTKNDPFDAAVPAVSVLRVVSRNA
jgi:hypothetical protein